MSLDRPAAPWAEFLDDLDEHLDGVTDFHCIGGFVGRQCYGLGRETVDLDVLTVLPRGAAEQVMRLAGRGSPLQA